MAMQFQYSRWRHGGWYVDNVRYPSGACGCVSRNYEDRKWRIACDPRPFEHQPTFHSRDDAAQLDLVNDLAAYQAVFPDAATSRTCDMTDAEWRAAWAAFEAWRSARYRDEWLALEARSAAQLVTIRVSPYITWQGPASRAAEARRF